MLRAWILSNRVGNENLGSGLSRAFFAARRLSEDQGFDLRTDALVCVHCRQRSSKKRDLESLTRLTFVHLFKFLRAGAENAQPLPLALRVQTSQSLSQR